MTCVVGIVHNGAVFIGADSAGVAGGDLMVRHDPKVFVKSGIIVGFTSSFRMGQLLHHAFEVPEQRRSQTVENFMVVTFVDAIRHCFQAGGYARKENETEIGGEFLVGYRGRLFKVESDYQVGESRSGYDACGCGRNVALGALFATAGRAPGDRVSQALSAAAEFSAGVRGPFVVKMLDRESVSERPGLNGAQHGQAGV